MVSLRARKKPHRHAATALALPPAGGGRRGKPRRARRLGHTVRTVPPPNLPFCSRFFERGHEAPVFTLMYVLVAPATLGLKRLGAGPAPAGLGAPPSGLAPLARVRARSGP